MLTFNLGIENRKKYFSQLELSLKKNSVTVLKYPRKDEICRGAYTQELDGVEYIQFPT